MLLLPLLRPTTTTTTTTAATAAATTHPHHQNIRYLDPDKKSADMQLGAFVRRVLTRMNINIRSLPRRRRSRRTGPGGQASASSAREQ